METFLLNLLKTSLLGALVIAALLALKPFWRERYRAKTRCWLWLALALFLLFPVDFSVKNAPVQAAPPKDYTLFVGTDKTTIQSTDNLFGDMAERSGQTSTQVRDSIIARPVTDPAQKTTRYIPVTTLLFYGYLAGAAAFLLYLGVSYALFRRTVRRWKRDVSRADYAFLLCDTARELGVKEPQMLVCEAITTPAVTGFFRPTLLLPHERYDLNDLRYILRHELCHLKRRDMLLKFVLLLANTMHWFDPMVYLMLRQADEDIELACDSAATDGLERAERAAYSRTLLAAVQSNVRALPATTCFGSTVERLKRRITNVLGAQKKRGLGIVALVLALTLTAGCAVGWGERAQTQKNGDPFDDKSYTVDILLYEAPAFTDGFTDGTYPTFRTATNPAGEKYVTMFNDLGYALIYGPMEEYKLEKQSFYALFGSTKASPVDDLIKNNRSAWSGYCEEASDGQPNRVYLLKQKDGTVYVGLAGDYEEDGSELFCSVFRLNEQIDPIYVSMDDYAAACAEDLKQGTMSYYVRVNGMGVVEDTVADVRVTQLEMGEALEGLSPEGTALELWYFNYEMKPTNESGYPIDPVGGQYVTDDGFLRESWTHYLTVLHHTSGEQTGYQIIGTTMSNDGLFYNGCGYSGEETSYLHDFYVDYAQLDLPKMFIPNLLNDTAADGYGYANQCEARLVAGEGYYYYVPITAWARSSDAEFWYSRYSTGSYFSVERIEKDIDEALREWTRQGYEVSRSGNVYRIVTSEGMSNTVVTFFSMPNSTCYQVETHWSFDGSTAENEWGWNRDRAVEGEAEVLRAMVRSFTVNWDADAAADPALDDSDFQADLQLASNGGAAWMYLSKDGTAISDRDMKNVAPTIRLEACDYAEHPQYDPPALSSFVPPLTGRVLELWLSNNDASHFAFYEGSNVMLYQCDEVRYYDVSNFGDYATLYDAMLAWYNSAQSGTETSDASSATTKNAVSRDSLIKAADSYVDLGGYLWYTAGGKLYRWHEGGSVETIDTLPLDYDTPVNASLSTQDDRILMSYHIGGAIMGSFITDLYDMDGKKLSSISGYDAIAISGDIVVITDHFMPTPNNLSISYDSGKTFTKFGDKDWYYGGALTEDGGYTTSVYSSLEIRDGYVYTTAVYDIDHEKSDDPLVTHAVRISVKTGTQEILD